MQIKRNKLNEVYHTQLVYGICVAYKKKTISHKGLIKF